MQQSRISLKTLQKKVMTPRFAFLGIVFLVAILLLVYSSYFQYHFQSYGYVRSYFPWRWHVTYTSSGSVSKLFEFGIGLSLILLLSSSFIGYWFLRASDFGTGQSLTQESEQPGGSANQKNAYPKFTKEDKSIEDRPVESNLEISQDGITTSATRKKETFEDENDGDDLISIAELRTKSYPQEPKQELDKTSAPPPGFTAQTRVKTFEKLHRSFGRKSFFGAVVMLILSASLLVISTRFPNIVLEVDSVVAFASGLVLLFKDQTHTVQSRVVDRVLSSSKEFVASLPNYGKLNTTDFRYLTFGRRIYNTFIIPATSMVYSAEGGGKDHKSPLLAFSGSNRIVPPGKELAELFQREMGQAFASLEELKRSLPSVVKDSLQLASFVSVEILGENEVRISLSHPAFRESCAGFGPSASKISVIGCPCCSMLATLFCHNTQRIVSLWGCLFTPATDTSVTLLTLGESIPEE